MTNNSERSVIDRLNIEIDAIKGLLQEGDPFLMTREDYLQNLEWILNGSNKQSGDSVVHG